MINHWDGLTVYLDHGIVPISNVIIEQQIRNLKLGAKNWLFAASEVGAETVAIFNSLVCTCKMNGINIQPKNGGCGPENAASTRNHFGF